MVKELKPGNVSSLFAADIEIPRINPNVDLNIERFYALIHKALSEGTLQPFLAENNLTVKEFGGFITDYLIGLTAAQKMLGHETPPVTLCNFGSTFYRASEDRIYLSLPYIAECVQQDKEGKSFTDSHIPKMRFGLSYHARKAGHEENTHAQNCQIDPLLVYTQRSADIRSENGVDQGVAYWTDPLEFYAGWHRREYIRQDLPEVSEHHAALDGADLHFVRQLRQGNLDHLPDYMKKMIFEKGEQLDIEMAPGGRLEGLQEAISEDVRLVQLEKDLEALLAKQNGRNSALANDAPSTEVTGDIKESTGQQRQI